MYDDTYWAHLQVIQHLQKASGIHNVMLHKSGTYLDILEPS
jgi:hypothetical protein